MKFKRSKNRNELLKHPVSLYATRKLSKGLFTWRWGTPGRWGNLWCVTNISCKRDQIKMRDYMDRRVTPPKRVTPPTWVPHLYLNRPRLGAIYKNTCCVCQATCIGKTGKNLCIHLTEHIRQSKKNVSINNWITTERHFQTSHRITWIYYLFYRLPPTTHLRKLVYARNTAESKSEVGGSLLKSSQMKQILTSTK